MERSVFDEAKRLRIVILALVLGVPAHKCPCCRHVILIRTQDGVDRWHCDGCHASGSVVDFMAKVKRCNTSKAARMIVALARSEIDLCDHLPVTPRRVAITDEATAALLRVIRCLGRSTDSDARGQMSRHGVTGAAMEAAAAKGWLKVIPGDRADAFRWISAKCREVSRLRRSGYDYVDRLFKLACRPFVFVAYGARSGTFFGPGEDVSGTVSVGRSEDHVVALYGAPRKVLVMDSPVAMLAHMSREDYRDCVMVGMRSDKWSHATTNRILKSFGGVSDWHVAVSDMTTSSRIMDCLASDGLQVERVATAKRLKRAA